MRYALIAVLLGLAVPFSFADAPAIQPATQPVAPDVYLVPFAPLGGDNSLDWAGKGVQQNLLTDLARAKLQVAAADKPIENLADAQTAAKAAGAKYLITGTYQVADTLVRFNGQIFDIKTGNVLGGLSATGSPRDLFNMEDSLSAQALGQLVHLPAAAVNKPAGPVPPALQPPAIVQIVQPPAVAQNGAASSYQGSALQQYVDSNRNPSTDYNQRVQDAQNRDTYDYGFSTPYGPYLGGYGFGYGYGLIYTVPNVTYHYGPGWNHRGNDER